MKPTQSTATSVRHLWPDRLFHWAMAISVLILSFSAFLPIAGIKFDWIPWHWIAGVVLTLLIIFHLIRVFVVHGISPMMPRADDVREIFGGLRRKSNNTSVLKPAKYDVYQKAYHWTTSITVLALLITGLPMLVKLDTVFWQRNPAILSDIQWGYIYVVHGFAALLLIFLVILHLYFSLLPEHKKLFISMLTGRGPQFARGEEHS